MNLQQLLEDSTAPALAIRGLADDSRDVRPGYAFLAVSGQTTDGCRFANDAIDRGASCILAEQPLPSARTPVITVPQLKTRRGRLAARFYRQPGKRMRLAGITGTNGKTSIAHHLASLASLLDCPTAYLGTLGWGPVADLQPTRLTTEGAVATQRRLACLAQRGLQWAAMEASSHALDQGRLDQAPFEFAVFSNLSRDHRDYHESHAAYAAAKRRLFEFDSLKTAIINIGDPWGRELAGSLPDLDVITYGSANADLGWRSIRSDAKGMIGRLRSPWGSRRIRAPVYGAFGLDNLAAAIAVLASGGFRFSEIAEAVSGLPAVPGRMEFLQGADGRTAVVDFAHTPDALTKALAAARPHTRGRLICVIGCGGDRDPGKRPLMAQAAAVGADSVWLTSDNPRSEDPEQIIDDMLAGLKTPAPGGALVRREADRADAIAGAIAEANPGDLVMVAGKGHEAHQHVGGELRPFSDREVIGSLLQPASSAAASAVEARG